MPTDSFSWLHLTDFHYGLRGQHCLWPNLRGPFLDSLDALHDKCGPWNAVLFTGDMVQTGKSDEFKKMQAEVLEPLWEKLSELGSGDAVLLAVPGNHDLFRPDLNEDDPAAERLVEPGGFERIERKFWERPAGSYRRVVGNAFAAYSEWWKAAPQRAAAIVDGILPGDFSTTLAAGSKRIGIIGLNTAFLQLAGGDYKGRLVWDARQIHDVCEGGVDVWTRQHDACLLLTHHGPDWLTPETRKHGESEIAPAGRFAVHCFGHQHELELTYIRSGGGTNAVRRCQGCSAFGMEKYGEPPTVQRAHGYSAGRIDFEEGKAALRIWPRMATNKTGRWRFIADGENAELRDDGGTEPEPVAMRRITAASASATALADVPAATAASAARSMAASLPHSTLPSRRVFFGRKPDLAKIAYALVVENGYQKHARFPTLDAAWPQLAAALPVLLAGDNYRLQTMCDALTHFLSFTGRWDEKLALNMEAETKAVLTKDFSNAGSRAFDVGFCHYLRGQSVEVLASADRAAAHWKRARGGTRERASVLRMRGLGHELAKDQPAAIAAVREAIELSRSLSPKSVNVASSLNQLAGILRASGLFDEAETHFRQALSMATALRDLEGMADYTGNLAELALDREQWPGPTNAFLG